MIAVIQEFSVQYKGQELGKAKLKFRPNPLSLLKKKPPKPIATFHGRDIMGNTRPGTSFAV